ncbi:uncharacterized protein LOC130898932 isoform X2 [Diorhabda carinulata]|uniref:uncharacterized protein LOC130898932 isoform X2 n=1 Tax=Diorhabda carinulata TaxID=1163345 RepID=UPI0025A14CEF|nr:uncharacterized protein LOC130898932 isoform X2 [Diorhabda carinulata]
MSTTKDKEDEDSSTKQILEYYRKYSQSRDLPKYFSGSVQYLPKIVDDDDEESLETRTINNIKVTESEIENCGPNIELSPTGSTTSNRKLEWDSLGDIGYIQRSASLPILTGLETKEQKGNNIKIVILPYTSSSEVSSERNTLQSSLSSHLEEKCIPTTSSSISKEQQRSSTDLESPQSDKKITEFQQSLDSIKKKIGLPGAHSTPYDSQSWSNKKITKKPKDFENSIEQFKQSDSDKASINKEKVDADGSREIDKPSKKVVNLCLTKPLLLDCLSHINTKKLTIGIQTDDSLQVPKQPHQLVTYYKHYDTLKVSSDSAKSTSSNAVASKCDSFEYIKNDSNDVKLGNNDAPVENLELTKSNKINDPVKSESSPQSENDLKTNDIERGVYVLQRLIKSKRYDSTTKKRYIKKVLQKITESKYLGDSSTSSDLFYPKVPQDHRKKSSTSHQSQEERKSPKKIKSVSTDSDLPYRMENKASPSKKIASSSVKEPSKKEQAAKETKKTLFTVTNCQEISSDQSSCSPQSYQNWKKLKTLSEKVFESNGQTIGGGDQISQFVNKERDYQLNWINKEIDHLGKLKHMLEKRKKPCHPPECMKKTSVYMVAAGNNEIERNYIIETKLGMPSSVRRNFILNGESYTVKNPRESDKETDQNVVTDIQVLSTDKTTNIKVTTFCKICKRAPCVCVTNFLQGISNPFEINHKVVKEHLDINSKSCTCLSNSTSSSNTTPSGKESSKTICIVCHRYPCTCCSCKQTHSVKTCSVCQLYSCMCVISPKESATLEPYVGTFIPTTRMEQNTDKPEEILCCNCEISPCNCGSSTTSTTNSLTKVFIDCKCGPSSECQCPFVDKLLQHFNNENFKSEKSNIGTCTLRKKSTTGTYNKQSTSTYTPRNFKNLLKEDQCVCTKEEKAVDPTNIYSTEDKSIGKTVKESVTQNGVKFKTADKAVSSRKTTSEKGVECNCETTVCDKGIGTNNKKPCVDRSTSPRTCLVDKGTACDPKGSQVDQCTSPKCTQMDKGTTSYPKGSQADQCTAPKCSQMEKGTTSDPKGLKVDQCTSPKCSQIDKGTTSDPKGLKVDQCTSPKCSLIDKGTTSNIRGVSVDQCTSCTPILIDRGSGYSPRILLDKYTSCAPQIDRGVVSETRTFVDKCVSPTRFNVDKETEWISGRISRDQGTTTGCSQMDRGTENYTKSLLNQCAATMFASGENRDEMTKDAYKVSETDVSATTNSSSNCTCCCCETSVPLERISMLRSGDQEFPICRECFDRRPVLTTVYFTDDESSSNNQKYSKDFIRRHLNFCTCKKDSKDFEYCSHCKNRLRKTQQSRNGIAYTLTLEDEPLENFKTRTKKKLKKLEEIKIKIPNPYSRKQHKNMENNHKKDEDRMKKIESGENSEDERLNEETSLKSSDATDNENNCTLQEYLKRNRPGFVNAAEYRRLAMMNNRIERELNKDDLKLKFLEKNAQNNKLKREKLFSEKEMRDITRRNYKKLPEVQQKLIDKRVQKLRNADKFMADMLKKKIQNCVLKGKSSFPIDTNIINVYN